MTGLEQTYRYARPSALTQDGAQADLLLSTSGGRTASGSALHPRFFDGFLEHPIEAAAALLTVAKVARTRFYVPPGMLAAILRAADPVVTSNGDRLRFESLSACCGVYARADLLPGSLAAPPLDTGTTNVDFNPPMRAALAQLSANDPLHLRVGEDVQVTTFHGSIIEEKVPLPARWLKGFAEVQAIAATMVPAFEVSAMEARRFVQSLPTAQAPRGSTMYAAPAGRGIRLTGRQGPQAVPLAAPDRLRALEPLLRYATALRAYAPSGSAGAQASAWELDLADARFTLTVSPEASRGFSGEGGLLRDLVDEASGDDADLVAALLAFEPRIDVERLSREGALPPDRILRALNRLASAGRVGYDLADAAYFHRELPYDPAVLEELHPRLRDARTLAEAGAVQRDPVDENLFLVESGGSTYVVRRSPTGESCTCPWYAKYRGDRGPCKHVLAVTLSMTATG